MRPCGTNFLGCIRAASGLRAQQRKQGHRAWAQRFCCVLNCSTLQDVAALNFSRIVALFPLCPSPVLLFLRNGTCHSIMSTSRGNEVVAFSREIRPIQKKTIATTDQPDSRFAKYMIVALDSSAFQIVMTLFTLYALFGSDIFILCKPPDSAEVVINVLDFITFVMFAMEFLLQCVGRKKYLFSFYFFLDAFATISLITTAFTLFDRNNALSSFSDSTAVQSASSFRAGRAARAAARAARIVRVSKLLILQKKNASKKNASSPSVIGGMLSDRLSIKIVSIITTMLIVTIFISFMEVPVRSLNDVWAISGPDILEVLNGYFPSIIHVQ